MAVLTEEKYRYAENSFLGFCTECGEFTRDCTELDAENYECPVCDKLTVVGVGQALILGLFKVDNEY